MKTFTAKQFHETPAQVYRAAVKSAVKITHAHHGDFIIVAIDQVSEPIKLDGVIHAVKINGVIE